MKQSHLIVDSPYEREQCVILAEGDHCLHCGQAQIRVVKEPMHGTFRNHYYCLDCGTQWYGNTYDSASYQMVKDKPFSIGKMLLILYVIAFVLSVLTHPLIAVLGVSVAFAVYVCKALLDKRSSSSWRGGA